VSDFIEKDGKKYYEESYITLANNNAARRGEKIKTLTAEIEQLRKIAAHVPGRIWIEAKEKAGFADFVTTKNRNSSSEGLCSKHSEVPKAGELGSGDSGELLSDKRIDEIGEDGFPPAQICPQSDKSSCPSCSNLDEKSFGQFSKFTCGECGRVVHRESYKDNG